MLSLRGKRTHVGQTQATIEGYPAQQLGADTVLQGGVTEYVASLGDRLGVDVVVDAVAIQQEEDARVVVSGPR